MNQAITRHILNDLRILKGKNPGDCYYDEYLKHYSRDGEDFYDQYHYAFKRVMSHKPKTILEIGVRTGLSICNMLSAYTDYSEIERIDLVDIWDDKFAGPGVVLMNLKAMNFPEHLISKVNFIKGDSLVKVPELVEQGITYDYILVDGNHSKEVAQQDLENVVPLCALGGVIVFDDISEYGCDLLDVWKAFKANYAGMFFCEENMKGKGTGWAVKKL